MRVLFLTYHFPTPKEAGAGRPWTTAGLLQELGHEPIVVTAGTHYMTGEDIRRDRSGLWSTEDVDGFRVIKTYAPPDYRRSLARRALNYAAFAVGALLAGMRQNNIDAVLMATDPMFIMPVGFILSKLKRVPLMLDERDVYPDTAVVLGVLTSARLIRALEAWHGFVRRRAQSILAATPGIKRLLVAKGTDPSKIFVLQNVRPASFTLLGDGRAREIRVRHEWDTKFVVLYSGNFGQANDIWTILKAAQLLRDRFPEIRFVFIGAGEKGKEYTAFCRAMDLDNVEFLAAKPWPELRGYLAAADLTVHAFPDKAFWDCALPTKIFDYLAAGKPVVFAGRGDTADLIAAAGAGQASEPGNPVAFAEAVARLSQGPETVREMGARGHRYLIEHFSDRRLQATMHAAVAALQRATS
jgi:glycosyltransferase involved in cell wall biosynthesis